MNDELNTLTRRLYAQGYTRDHHPDSVYWGDWQNFCYKWETMLQFTWETPCGLLIQGESNVGRDVAVSECFYQHIWSARKTTIPCSAVRINGKAVNIFRWVFPWSCAHATERIGPMIMRTAWRRSWLNTIEKPSDSIWSSQAAPTAPVWWAAMDMRAAIMKSSMM